ncbi:DUF4113 domain-containing protein [Oscillatoria sp. CS-180]|uniref:DUF4113 domain-containing protein n=1 Tax=Oscillatoria sp. CS-180 TaxID=3021720 RepID=UPI00232EEDD5|nr:DUF4113 domain-containing protein [Oscillatoria sp. CS-180]MDB9529569.1 DUF4113 domain-containing protein [Oscillatoria sp. CS-180]
MDSGKHVRSHRLINLVDQLNRRFGPETVRSAAAGREQGWQTRFSFGDVARTPQDTTRWDELMKAD